VDDAGDALCQECENEGGLSYAGEKLIDDTWGWLVARPQRTDGETWLKTLAQYLDARDQVKLTTPKPEPK